MSGDLCARLDKTGLRVLCGPRDCGGEIAQIAEDTPRGPAFLGEPQVFRVLVVGPGFTADGGVLRLSRNARRRLAQGRPSALKRRYRPTAVEERENPDQWPIALPIRAECPRCGSLQTLDASRLRVDGIRWQPSFGLSHAELGRKFFESIETGER